MTTTVPKIIVITGASRGLGRALVAAFVRDGHHVHGCARNDRQIGALQKEYGPPHSFTTLDVTQDQAVEHWAADVLRSAGPPDLLINNAAIINRNASLWELPAEEFDRVIDINIKGVANTIRHFVPAMIARGSGVILNLSSGWGRSTAAEVAPYCATKYAIEGLSKALAQELPDTMASIPVSPGIIDTDMLQSSFGSGASSYIKPEAWAKIAAPYFLSLGPQHSGASLTVPGQ
ncbi:MAG TPA: SDR family oxidoreductase [Pirellulales bacterium]|jgi:NAD(P)-dependent dehydrogenase (short-subunit alcohol dehydrogenase family)|nr:SDR family oxidoreductase [Pirellulales bacterium]